MGQSNDRNRFVVEIPLGSPSTDVATILGAYFRARRSCSIEKAELINGANVGADLEDHTAINLKNGSDIVASYSTQTGAEGALTAHTPAEMTIDQDKKDIAAGSTLTVQYDETEVGVNEVTTVDCVADVSDSLDGTYFVLYDDVGSVAFWIDTDDSGTSIPAGAAGEDRAVEITTIATDDSAETVATKVAAVVNADAKFSAAVDGTDLSLVRATASTPGNKTDGADGAQATGFTIVVETQGQAVVTQALTSAVLVIEGIWKGSAG